jgi:hypothetical protein
MSDWRTNGLYKCKAGEKAMLKPKSKKVECVTECPESYYPIDVPYKHDNVFRKSTLCIKHCPRLPNYKRDINRWAQRQMNEFDNGSHSNLEQPVFEEFYDENMKCSCNSNYYAKKKSNNRDVDCDLMQLSGIQGGHKLGAFKFANNFLNKWYVWDHDRAYELNDMLELDPRVRSTINSCKILGPDQEGGVLYIKKDKDVYKFKCITEDLCKADKHVLRNIKSRPDDVHKEGEMIGAFCAPTTGGEDVVYIDQLAKIDPNANFLFK